MNNVFVIDKATKCNLGLIDFIPRKDDRISMKASEWKEVEVTVECVLYEPLEHAVLVFVNITEPCYTPLVKSIKWWLTSYFKSRRRKEGYGKRKNKIYT